jgi:hypothetical protein
MGCFSMVNIGMNGKVISNHRAIPAIPPPGPIMIKISPNFNVSLTRN